jgi:hypothetical protein
MHNSQLRTFQFRAFQFPAFVAAACLLVGPATAWAQPGAGDPISFDPIRCWWRTSAAAVRTGETFSVVLTCALLDTDDARAIADEQKLNVSVVQFAPFEVVGGSRAADIRTPGRRFFQYDYILRAISPDLIGQDVPLPLFEITYRIESRLADNSAQVGRDLTYMLPPQKVRVVSMVPNDADDIRDTSTEAFGRVEALRSRAGLLRVVAVGLLALGGLMAVLTLVGLVARARRGAFRPAPVLTERALVSAAARELAALQREAGGSWSDPLVARAAAAARLVAAVAMGRTVAQRPAGAGEATSDGRLVVRQSGLKGRRLAVSSAATPAGVDRYLARRAGIDQANQGPLEELRAALATLDAAQYSATPDAHRTDVERAVQQALDAAKRVRLPRRSAATWLRRLVGMAPAQEAHP